MLLSQMLTALALTYSDFPIVKPTKKSALWAQMLGRGTRTVRATRAHVPPYSTYAKAQRVRAMKRKADTNWVK